MQANPAILQHWKISKKDFDLNLALLKQHINTNAVHDIRVATKKLRAFLSLYMVLKKEPDWEFLFNNTKNLFDILGRHRDIEICLTQTISYEKETDCSCKEFRYYLQSLLKTTRAWANQDVHRYHKKDLAKVALLLKEDSTLSDDNSFAGSLKAIIYSSVAETKNNLRRPHLVRKNLKEIYYWIPLFADENLEASWHLKELHSILDDLGNWQDHEILDVRLRHFRKDYLPKTFNEYQLLKNFQIKIRHSKKVLLKSANSKARSWMKMVADKEKSEA